MNRLCVDGLVASRTVRQPGKSRGVLLVDFASLMTYLDGCPSAVATPAKCNEASHRWNDEEASHCEKFASAPVQGTCDRSAQAGVVNEEVKGRRHV